VRLWLVAWSPVLLWAAVIFGLSAIPGTQLPPVDVPQADKLAHLLVYSVMGALVLRGVRRNRQISTQADQGDQSGRDKQWALRPSDFAAAIVLTTLYGVSDELHQYWTPNRSPDWHDVVADALGAALGSLVFVATRWMKIRVCFMMGRSKN
jgi:VanZ family protein